MTEKYVTDTTVLIEKIVSSLVKKKEIKGIILIPHAVIAELENQANRGLEIGFLGLDEIQELRKLKGIKVHFIGERPNEHQIRHAKSGEIDAYIREITLKQNAILITADKVMAESAKAFGIEVKYYDLRQPKEKLEIEKFFDNQTMSVHLKEDCYVYAKRGFPGAWKLEQVSKEKLKSEDIQRISKEIVEYSRIDPKTFIEISRRGSTIIQYKYYRVVIVKPPVSDGWEITAVKPIKKLNIEDYNLPENILKRLIEKASGVLIVGETGSGKSTFAAAIAELYVKNNKVVKTIESPRDLVLTDRITQYSKNFASSEEIHDILFLSRPDYILFDEIRDTPDFELYTDLKLGAANVIGVLHSASPIDAIQRFVSRLEVGMIPSVVDTILFIDSGNVKEVYILEMIVKVPTGMTESDLARPIIEVRDFRTNKLEYEIYSYGEETVVIPIKSESKSRGAKRLAEKEIEREFKKYTSKVKVELISDNKARVYVSPRDIPHIIGQGGKMIEAIEGDLGISLEIEEFKKEKSSANLEIKEDKDYLIFYGEPGVTTDICIDDKFVFSAITSKKGIMKIHKKSALGRDLLKAMNSGRKIEFRA